MAARRPRRARGASLRAGRERRGEHRVLPRALRRHPRRPHARGEQLALAELPHGPQRALVTRQRRAARRRGAHRALLDRLGHEARDGGRDRARVGVPRPRATSGARSPPTRTSAGRSSRARSAPRRRASSGSRASRATSARSRAQFAFNLLTRSRRITYDNLRVRDPGFVASVDDDFTRSVAAASNGRGPIPPMFLPFRLRDLVLPNRVVVSPMDMYSAVDGAVERLPPRPPRQRGPSAAPALVMTRDDCTSARGPDHARAAAGCTATSTSPAGSGSSTSSTPTARRASARSSATAGARARRSSCGRGSTSRSRAAAGPSWPRRRCPTSTTARCRAR